jgi:hypothetical protein
MKILIPLLFLFPLVGSSADTAIGIPLPMQVKFFKARIASLSAQAELDSAKRDEENAINAMSEFCGKNSNLPVVAQNEDADFFCIAAPVDPNAQQAGR